MGIRFLNLAQNFLAMLGLLQFTLQVLDSFNNYSSDFIVMDNLDDLLQYYQRLIMSLITIVSKRVEYQFVYNIGNSNGDLERTYT